MTLNDANLDRYFKMASEARDKAYCPYSNHPVGAVVIDENGNAHAGCNISAAHYKGICAEGCAISHMIMAGGRQIKAVVVVGPSDEYLCTPCGDCRQRIREFATDETAIYSMWTDGRVGAIHTMEELLPMSFGPDHITIRKET